MESISAVTVTDRELDNHLEAATAKLFGFSFKPPRAQQEDPSRTPAATLGGRRFTYRPMQNAEGPVTPACAPQKFSFMEPIRDINNKDDLYSDTEHLVLRSLRRSLQIFFQIY